jgi:hypothetical protein
MFYFFSKDLFLDGPYIMTLSFFFFTFIYYTKCYPFVNIEVFRGFVSRFNDTIVSINFK